MTDVSSNADALNAVLAARKAAHETRKAARQALREAVNAAADAGITYAEIGRALGVSRERVRQLAGTPMPRSPRIDLLYPRIAPVDDETLEPLLEAQRAVLSAQEALQTAVRQRASRLQQAHDNGNTYASIAAAMGTTYAVVYQMVHGRLAKWHVRTLSKGEVQPQLDHALAAAVASGVTSARAARLAAVSVSYAAQHVDAYNAAHGVPSPVPQADAETALAEVRADWLAAKVARKRLATKGTKP